MPRRRLHLFRVCGYTAVVGPRRGYSTGREEVRAHPRCIGSPIERRVRCAEVPLNSSLAVPGYVEVEEGEVRAGRSALSSQATTPARSHGPASGP